MIPFETLAELFEIAIAPYNRAAAPPTPQSLARIQQHLGIRIPDDYVRFATMCPSYGSWLASIGDDFDNGLHILNLNAVFHDCTPVDGEGYVALPKHLIILNHGHDGDCDCWDTRTQTASGEHPIIYACIDATAVELGNRTFPSFHAYAEYFILYQVASIQDQTQRQKADRLIESFGLRKSPGPRLPIKCLGTFFTGSVGFPSTPLKN